MLKISHVIFAVLLVPCLMRDPIVIPSIDPSAAGLDRAPSRFTSQALSLPETSGHAPVLSPDHSLVVLVTKMPLWIQSATYTEPQRALAKKIINELPVGSDVPVFPPDFLAAALESDRATTVHGIMAFMNVDPTAAKGLARAVNNSLGRHEAFEPSGTMEALISLPNSTIQDIAERLIQIPEGYLKKPLERDASELLAIKLKEHVSRMAAQGSPTVRSFFLDNKNITQVLWDIGIRDAWDLEIPLRHPMISGSEAAAGRPRRPRRHVRTSGQAA